MFYATLVLAIFVVVLLAEISPEAVNALLILILLGLVLGRAEDTEKLIATISQAAGSSK